MKDEILTSGLDQFGCSVDECLQGVNLSDDSTKTCKEALFQEATHAAADKDFTIEVGQETRNRCALGKISREDDDGRDFGMCPTNELAARVNIYGRKSKNTINVKEFVPLCLFFNSFIHFIIADDPVNSAQFKHVLGAQEK